MKNINLPTKSQLLEQSLVAIDNEHKNVTTNTLKVSEYFGKQHKNILQRINNLVENSRLKIQPSKYIDDRGKEQTYYILDRKNFSVVVLGFTGEQAEVFRIEYVDQFEKQIAELSEWRKTRQTVIEPTKICNGSIEWLELRTCEEIERMKALKLPATEIRESILSILKAN